MSIIICVTRIHLHWSKLPSQRKTEKKSSGIWPSGVYNDMGHERRHQWSTAILEKGKYLCVL